MNFDWQFIAEITGVLLGGGGLGIFLDRKAKKKALDIENKKSESEVKKDEESFAMQNIKERYNELEIRHNELVERHKAVIAEKQTMLEEMLELKKVVSDREIEINKLKSKNKELSTRLKNKGNGK
jgi:uncharacterized protein (DUF3084 family)